MNDLQRFVTSADWTGFTLGDLREVLQDLILVTLARDGQVLQEDIDRWGRGQCDAELDFLVHSFAVVSLPVRDDPAKSTGQQILDWQDLPLGPSSKANLHNVYLNAYFYKYIAGVELPGLMVSLSSAGGVHALGIDWYITQLLYRDVVEANPGRFFTYSQIPGEGANRIAALQQIRTDLESAINGIGATRFESLIENLRDQWRPTTFPREDVECILVVFRSIFFLMTYYVGSAHRRVHDAVTALLGVTMADFRESFFGNLPSIIEHRGGLRPQVGLL